jgi:hypothetical protein
MILRVSGKQHLRNGHKYVFSKPIHNVVEGLDAWPDALFEKHGLSRYTFLFYTRASLRALSNNLKISAA